MAAAPLHRAVEDDAGGDRLAARLNEHHAGGVGAARRHQVAQFRLERGHGAAGARLLAARRVAARWAAARGIAVQDLGRWVAGRRAAARRAAARGVAVQALGRRAAALGVAARRAVRGAARGAALERVLVAARALRL